MTRASMHPRAEGLPRGDWPALTLPQMLREQARRQPARIALRQKDYGIWQPIDWATYWRRACQVALGLRAAGLEPGGKVAIIAENRLEWLLAQMGAGVLGAVPVGVYCTSPAAEVGYVLEHAEVDMVVCEDQEQTDKVLEVAARLPGLRRIVVMETKGLRNHAEAERARMISFAELEARGAQCGAAEQARLSRRWMRRRSMTSG